jgi:hypothetical protein
MKAKLLSFIFISFFESGLFNGLQPKKIKKIASAFDSPFRLCAKRLLSFDELPSHRWTLPKFRISIGESIPADRRRAKDLLTATGCGSRKIQPRQGLGADEAKDRWFR